MTARWAKVVAVYPEARAADLVFLDTGARVPMVTVLCDTVSTNTGDLDLPEPTAPPEAYSASATKDRDVYAAVLQVGGLPAIVGFKVPEVCQMTFKRKNFKVYRHASDLYWTCDDDGNFEFFHPSGSYIRIATDAAHEDLTALDFDKRWKIARNTDKAVHVALVVKNAGVQKASLDLTPTGDVTLAHVGNLSATTEGNATIAVTGNITSSAAVWNHTGPIHVTGGDITADGIGLKAHHHTAQGATAATTAAQA